MNKDVEEFWRQLMDKIDLAEWLRRIEHEHRFDNEFTRIEPTTCRLSREERHGSND